MDKIRFNQMLINLAQLTNFTANEMTLEIYNRALEKYGYGKLMEATFKFVESGIKKFPTIPEFKKAMGVPTEEQLTYEEQAKVIGDLIKSGVGDLGRYAKSEDVIKHIGPIGFHIINKRGGWQTLCDCQTEKDLEFEVKSIQESIVIYLKNPSAVENIRNNGLPSSEKFELPSTIKALLETGMKLEE